MKDIADDIRSGKTNVRVDGWNGWVEEFSPYINDLRNVDFQLNQTIAQKVDHFLDTLRSNRNGNVTLVGIHVRRYLDDLIDSVTKI